MSLVCRYFGLSWPFLPFTPRLGIKGRDDPALWFY